MLMSDILTPERASAISCRARSLSCLLRSASRSCANTNIKTQKQKQRSSVTCTSSDTSSKILDQEKRREANIRIISIYKQSVRQPSYSKKKLSQANHFKLHEQPQSQWSWVIM